MAQPRRGFKQQIREVKVAPQPIFPPLSAEAKWGLFWRQTGATRADTPF
jgi:hypothetical protein